MIGFTRTFSLLITVGFLSACSGFSEKPSTVKTTKLQTGYLQNKAGYVGDVMGAEVISIKELPDQELQVIEIHVPIDPNRVDKVQAISNSGELIKQDRTAEILKNYENNDVGLKLYFPKQKNWTFKLKLIDEVKPD